MDADVIVQLLKIEHKLRVAVNNIEQTFATTTKRTRLMRSLEN